MMKKRTSPTRLEDLPNVGPATAGDLRLLGITHAPQLAGRDPYQMHEKLCALTGVRHDPCVIDVFIACVRYMEGAPAKPWWAYTSERKRSLAAAAPRTPRKRTARGAASARGPQASTKRTAKR
jgi:hypothetical protein